MISCHTDVVGSLLRPPELLTARRLRDQGMLDPPGFKAIEDAAVDAAVALQEEAGLEVVSDGEMRRLSFQSVFTEAVLGFAPHGLDAFLWGDWHGEAPVGDSTLPRPDGLAVVSRLERRRPLAAEELVYLRARTRRIAKVALPSPSLFVNFWSSGASSSVYPTCDAMLADVVDILREEIAELARLGATYIQIDAPHYTSLLDPNTRTFYESSGWTMQQWLDRGIELDNAVMEPHPNVTYGFHLCRGNQASRWLVSGAYDPISSIFRRIRAGRLLLEYDDERSGGFDALRSVPEDKFVVLGLVTTKSPRVETPEALAARVREAERYVPRERLAISPQCGFASSIIGNRLSVEVERQKLEALGRAARLVWGATPEPAGRIVRP